MSYDIDHMKKRMAEVASGGSFWKPPVGSTKIRILPGTVGNCDDGTFFRTIRTHNFKFADGFRTFAAASNGTWSPIEACRDLFKVNGMKEEAKTLNVRTQFAMNIVVDGSEEVKTWKCSAKILEKLIDLLPDEDWGDFTDPVTGYCIKVTRKGEGLQTRYDVVPSNTKGALPAGWNELAHDLTVEDGDEPKDTEIIPILVDKFEDSYDDLETELLSMKKAASKTKETAND
jgi:hypothetical protein